MDRRRFANVPFMALTASATAAMVKEIRSVLHADANPKGIALFQACSFRPNLHLSVRAKARGKFASVLQLYELVRSSISTNGCAIVYVQTQKETIWLCKKLNVLGIPTKPFHANLPTTMKSAILQWFKAGVVGVVVATVAFGMGIDRPDVRLVVHFTIPRDIISYYQEVGRAGRDGQKSTCVLLYSVDDVDIAESRIYKERGGVLKLCALRNMQQFCTQAKLCRHVELIKQFQHPSMHSCSYMCDICELLHNVQRGN